MKATHPADPVVRLNPDLDLGHLAKCFRDRGRVHIPGILDAVTAARVHRCLTEELPWRLVLLGDQGPQNLAVADPGQLPPSEREQLERGILQRAAQGFQYVYNSFPIFECHRDGLFSDLYVMRLYEFMNSPEFIGFVRELTGLGEIDYADAQATLYRPGHFLTRHDDTSPGQHRQAAYVFNFTPGWRAEWGGLLAFVAPDGHVAEAWAPAFNALNLFRVPALHMVTEVASYAAAGRYSITGWLRQRAASG